MTSAHNWSCERTKLKVAAMQDNEAMSQLTAQISALATQVSKLTTSNSNTSNQVLCCEICSGPHSFHDCPQTHSPTSASGEQMNYVGNYQRGNQGPYTNTYNPGWANHPNFSWRNENNVYRQPGFQRQGPMIQGLMRNALPPPQHQ